MSRDETDEAAVKITSYYKPCRRSAGANVSINSERKRGVWAEIEVPIKVRTNYQTGCFSLTAAVTIAQSISIAYFSEISKQLRET